LKVGEKRNEMREDVGGGLPSEGGYFENIQGTLYYLGWGELGVFF